MPHIRAALASIALLPAIAAGARAQVIDHAAPPPFEEDETESPLLIDLSAIQRFTFDADLEDDAGSVSIARTRLGVGFTSHLTEKIRLRVTLEGEYSHYDFRGDTALVPGAGDPFDELFIGAVSPVFTYLVNDDWSWIAGARGHFTGELDADFGDSLTGWFFGAARYRFNADLAIAVGGGVMTRLEDSARIIPYIGIEWQASDKVQVISEGLSVVIRADVHEEWSVGARFGWEPREYRLSDDAPLEEGVVRDERVIVAGELAWRPTSALEASVGLGAVVLQEFELLDNDGDTVSKVETDPAPFIIFRLIYRF